MSEILEAILLGIVQGLTEFLPVSSSGHLELFKYFFDKNIDTNESILMTVTLHGATALSTMFVLRNEIAQIFKGLFTGNWNEQKKWILLIVLSMVPTAIFFLGFEDWITNLFDGNILMIAGMLGVTGLLLLIADRPWKGNQEVSWRNTLMMGVAQAFAIIPGISRSGATIATGVVLGLDRGEAARFSFLMVLPLIFGKMFLDLIDGDYALTQDQAMPLIFGAIAAFIVGCIASQWMIQLVRNSKLSYFAYYCFAVAAIILVTMVVL